MNKALAALYTTATISLQASLCSKLSLLVLSRLVFPRSPTTGRASDSASARPPALRMSHTGEYSRFFAAGPTAGAAMPSRRVTRSQRATGEASANTSAGTTTTTTLPSSPVRKAKRKPETSPPVSPPALPLPLRTRTRTRATRSSAAPAPVVKSEQIADIEDFASSASRPRRATKRARVGAEARAPPASRQDSAATDDDDDDSGNDVASGSGSDAGYEQEQDSPSASELSAPPSSDESDGYVSGGGGAAKKSAKTRSRATARGDGRSVAAAGGGSKARARKPARKTKAEADAKEARSPLPDIPASGSEPPHWRELYALVLQMRQPGGIAGNAAVDTMGCERLADRSASARDQRFHTLVSLMLSSQTKDTVTSVVMKRLQTELPGYGPGAPAGLNVENVLAVDAALLNEMIWAVGFHNNKTKYIKQTAEILRDKWHSDIPDTIAGLTSLPGVGPKMAYLCMSHAWHRTEGIGVDVHVHRLTNMWAWHRTRTPEETRVALQRWLPHDRWAEINWLLVGFGQTVCPAAGRNCGGCDVGLAGLCVAADKKKVAEGLKWATLGREKTEDDMKAEKKMEGKAEGEAEGKAVKLGGVGATEDKKDVKTPINDEVDHKQDFKDGTIRVKKEQD
ncbi:uncharacterized protein BROUX77_007980 [Berkeleyomyces rouxiae]|uniref:uncharacterized protein n=1 Tax=Berkeleyomyces rouxiae TaxID=2035830 RepID=UPI003B78A8E0